MVGTQRMVLSVERNEKKHKIFFKGLGERKKFPQEGIHQRGDIIVDGDNGGRYQGVIYGYVQWNLRKQ